MLEHRRHAESIGIGRAWAVQLMICSYAARDEPWTNFLPCGGSEMECAKDAHCSFAFYDYKE
jgi:hypothetical protein